MKYDSNPPREKAETAIIIVNTILNEFFRFIYIKNPHYALILCRNPSQTWVERPSDSDYQRLPEEIPNKR
jgi:hypothetical protein